MKQRIIALIDFTAYSEHMLVLVNNWMKVMNYDVLLIHQIETPLPVFVDATTKSRILQSDLEKKRFQLISYAKKFLDEDVVFDAQVIQTPLITSLPEFFTEGFHDIVMVGVKGSSTLKTILLGNTASRIVDELNAVVIALPKLVHPDVPQHMFVATNFKFPINQEQLHSFLKQSKGCISSLTFFSIIKEEDDQHKAKTYLMNLQKEFSTRAKVDISLLMGNDPLKQTKKLMQHHSGCLLVVQKGSRSIKDSLFRKYFINELIEDGQIPLLVLN